MGNGDRQYVSQELREIPEEWIPGDVDLPDDVDQEGPDGRDSRYSNIANNEQVVG